MAHSCSRADLQPGEDSARQTGKAAQIQGEDDRQTHPDLITNCWCEKHAPSVVWCGCWFTLTIRDSTPQSDSLSSRKASRVSLLQQHRKASFFFLIKDMEFMRHWAVMDEVIKLQSSYNLGSLIRCWIKRLVSSFEAIFMTLSLCRSFWCQKIIDLFFQSNITIRVFFPMLVRFMPLLSTHILCT